MRAMSKQLVTKTIGIHTNILLVITYPVTFTTGLLKEKAVLSGVKLDSKNTKTINFNAEY